MAVPLSELAPDPKNARLHNERNLGEIVKSYQTHGQRKPIVVQRQADNGTRMVVRAGNGQLEAAKQLGWSHIAAIVVDEDDRAAIAFALRDNRTAELAEWDYRVLAEEAAAFEADGESLADLGWNDAEMVPLRETTWFMGAKGELEEHSRPPKDEGGKDKEEVTVVGQDAADFREAAGLMRDKFKEPGMNLGHVIGRLARHYLATLTHSKAPTN